MTVKIIEKFIKSKKQTEELCEDGIFAGKRFYAVVDGATSKSDFLVNGKTTGKMATDLIIKSLHDLDDYVGELSFHDIQYKINNSFNYTYKEYFQDNKNERMIASAVIFDCVQDIIYLVGDCQILLKNEKSQKRITNDAKINNILANRRSHFNNNLIHNCGITEEDLMKKDLGREHIFEDLKNQTNLINNLEDKYGFFVFDGSVIPDDKIITRSTKDFDIVVLSSDGYPKLFESLQESEEYLESVLINDPLLIHKHKSTKGILKGNVSFDDRSYLKIETNHPTLKNLLSMCDSKKMKESNKDAKPWMDDKPKGRELF